MVRGTVKRQPAAYRYKGPPERAQQFGRIKRQLRTPEARTEYLALPKVKLWLKRNAAKLKVVDVRYFARPARELEWAEIYYLCPIVKKVRRRLVAGDPPPHRKRLNGR